MFVYIRKKYCLKNYAFKHYKQSNKIHSKTTVLKDRLVLTQVQNNQIGPQKRTGDRATTFFRYHRHS